MAKSRPTTAMRLFVALVAFGVLATACGSQAAEVDSAAPAVTEAATAESATAEATSDDPVIPLTGTYDTASGETVDLSTFEGQDVVLWFWAPW